jgi:hypothetical protein
VSARLVWNGLKELRADLIALPAALTADAEAFVIDAGQEAKAEIGAVYAAHSRSGHLAKGLQLSSEPNGTYEVRAVLRSRAPHAWLFDNGSQARHYTTKRGVPHSTGAMWSRTPPTHAFVATVMRKRREMYERLKLLLMRHGLRVSGDAAA